MTSEGRERRSVLRESFTILDHGACKLPGLWKQIVYGLREGAVIRCECGKEWRLRGNRWYGA